MSKNKKKRPQKTQIPEVSEKEKEKDTDIPKPELADQEFRFVTVYPWLNATSKYFSSDGFTNLCKDSEQFACLITTLLEDIIPVVNKNYDSIFFKFDKKYRHCHQLDEKKASLANKLSKELTSTDFSDIVDGSDYSWWQLGVKESIRIVGIFSKTDNVFYPIFVDWHHLMFSSIKYNQADFSKYSYCPHKKPL